jgi:anthranilate 1,2-dioxygenase small subunit
MPNIPLTIELKSEVEQLLNSYVQCIDDDDLEHWPDFFTEDCL